MRIFVRGYIVRGQFKAKTEEHVAAEKLFLKDLNLTMKVSQTQLCIDNNFLLKLENKAEHQIKIEG